MTGLDLIQEERKRQLVKLGWTKDHDTQHKEAELGIVAVLYIINGLDNPKLKGDIEILQTLFDIWPKTWSRDWDKRDSTNQIKSLVKAGALIAGEIDRLQNKKGDER